MRQFFPKSWAKDSCFIEIILGMQKDYGHGPAITVIRSAWAC
jgi:hypothetical protein